ncbi:hypothetical protein A8C32_09585 [Flavivirga aquatica]|uniref:ATPase n=1 Tax=Flavivirga aquatica TaxID=1849968 RepID=A0A1E5TEF0_9FLAO|nr:hypothetical protein [Flavivirga aquatica]OEK09756.1 hypothetical protein A8C32_09585 [Flavivirga aquatica]
MKVKNNVSNYSKQIELSTNSEHLFYALTEGLSSWWGKTSNTSLKTNGQFTIHFENGYWWAFKIMEFTPNKELIWKCIAGEPLFNKEWIGHVLHWKIEAAADTKVKLNFHQIGLTPDILCYGVCSSTWDMFIVERLKNYVEQVKN